jgi:micrococcal nuclease
MTVARATVVGMKRAFPVIVVVLLLGSTVVYHQLRSGSAPLTRGTVSRVVDGDTIYVSAGGRSQDVRLIGVDTPETVDPNRPVGCYGPQASAFMKHWLTGRPVTLVYDRVLHDKYGRSLAYVYTDGVSVERRLLRLGYARTLSIPPNVAHAAEYSALESAAAVAGRGLWSACQ